MRPNDEYFAALVAASDNCFTGRSSSIRSEGGASGSDEVVSRQRCKSVGGPKKQRASSQRRDGGLVVRGYLLDLDALSAEADDNYEIVTVA